MASDPLPSASNEAAEDTSLPSNAEDRKAAEAMSKLEDRGDDDGAASKEVDTEALGQAMKNLAMGTGAAKAAELKKKVKVEAADVTLVVRGSRFVNLFSNASQMDQLDMSKAKATDLLRAHDGDALKAMTAFVMAPLPPPRIIT
jgi:hypothetical protein